MSDWVLAETTTHQDHVIAHVVGATVDGYIVWDETAYLLLDIGFVWNIFVDGEMGLVPHPVWVTELESSKEVKSDLRADVDALLQSTGSLRRMTESPVRSPIQTVQFFMRESSRRLVLTCEEGELVVETSLQTGEVQIYEA